MSEIEELPRTFQGIWIPREIWLHPDLGYFEKVLWAEINSLDGIEKGCTASNAYLCKLLNTRERTLQNALSKLKNLGFIKYQSFDGRKRTIRSSLKSTHEKFYTSQVKNSAPLPCKNLHPENIDKRIDKNPPLTPPKPKKGKTPSAPPTKAEWRKRISSEWTDEEFDFAWTKIQNNRGTVFKVQEWLEATMQNYRNAKGFSSDDRISRHREQAIPYDWAKIDNCFVYVCKDRVEFVNGPYFKSVSFDLSDEEWESQTKNWFKK